MIRVNDGIQFIPWREGLSVRDVLKAAGYDFVLITVTVNDRLIPEDEYDSMTVPENADFKAIHLHHGG